jgi:hypothetical protein
MGAEGSYSVQVGAFWEGKVRLGDWGLGIWDLGRVRWDWEMGAWGSGV